MKKRIIYQLDAFTTERFKGNPAGVLVNADGLTDDEMLLIARELDNSETAFLFEPNQKDHALIIRYITPTTEVPSCGACHYFRHICQSGERRIGFLCPGN